MKKMGIQEKNNVWPVLSIAGSDSSGGAGIQADLKTMLANGCYGMTAITALTAQNTMGVRAVSKVAPDFLQEQLCAVFEDIMPLAVKTGMVASKELIMVIAECLKRYDAHNIVIDPVMVATSGSPLLKEDAIACMEQDLFPLATLLTPNIPEAEILSGVKIHSREDMVRAGQMLSDKYHTGVLIKGGHAVADADDVLVESEIHWFHGKRIENDNTHGTGCTLSSAIACGLAKGYTLVESIECAKRYLSDALAAGLNLGHGSGPLDHGYFIGDRGCE